MVTRFWYESPKISECLRDKLSGRYVTDRIVTGYMSPSGRISVGVLPPDTILSGDEEYESLRPHDEYLTKKHWDAFEGIVSESVVVRDDLPSLGLSAESNHHSTQVRRCGLRGITDNGRNRVYEGAKLLEGRYGRRLGFYTLTCPYKDSSLIYEFNRNIGEVQRRWFQELKRFYERQGITFSYVSVVEWQTERYRSTSIPVLHLHYIAPCYRPCSREFVLGADGLRYLWMRLLSSIFGVEVDTSASVDAQVIKKSASGYLAKYLSKGGGIGDFISGIAPSQFPRQWWSMSANVRRAIKRNRTQIPQPIAEWYFQGGDIGSDGCLRLNYRRDVYVQWKGQALRVGMGGQICQEGLLTLRNNSIYALSLLFL